MSDTTKAEITMYLGNIDRESPECYSQECCPDCPEHKDCGICRYEYMLEKGWLI